MKKSSNHSELILNMNTRLFNNTLQGVTEDQAAQRLSDHNNSLIWLATHTVWARYNILNFLGKPATNPYAGMFENFKPYNPADKYPTIAEVKAEWNKASSLLTDAIKSVNEEHLAAESPFKSPIGEHTNGGAVAFLTQHESYEIGQMGFLKKFHTKEAMSYN